jgi:Putative addiction module component
MPSEDLKREALKRQTTDSLEESSSRPPLSFDEEDQEVDPEHERLWREEIQRRYREYKEGRAQVFDAEEVIAAIRSELA